MSQRSVILVIRTARISVEEVENYFSHIILSDSIVLNISEIPSWTDCRGRENAFFYVGRYREGMLKLNFSAIYYF